MGNSDARPKRPWWRRRRTILAAAGFTAILAAWLTGLPQRWIAEWAITRATGLESTIEWGGAFPELRIEHAHFFADAAAKSRGQPLVSATDIRAKYRVWSKDRNVESVKIGLLLVDFDPDDPGLRDLPIFKADPNAETSETFIPERVEIGGVAIRVHREDGTFALLDEFRLNADLRDTESVRIETMAESQLFVLNRGDTRVRLENVGLTGSGRYERGRLTWSQRVEQPGLLHVSFAIDGTLTGEDAHVDVEVAGAGIEGDGVSHFLETAALSVHFSGLAVESAAARIYLGNEMTGQIRAAARVYQPRLPGAAEPLYGDTVQISLDADASETIEARCRVVLASGQTAQANFSGTAEAGDAKFQTPEWTRAQFFDAVPAAFREGLQGLSFDTFRTDMALRWTKTEYQLEGRAESMGGGADAAPISWSVSANGMRDGSQGIEGTAEARLGERRIRASARYDSEDRYLAEATIEEVQIAPWIQLLLGGDLAERVQGTIEGTLRAEATGKGAPLEIRPALKLRKFVYDTLELDEITAGGALRYSKSENRWHIDELRAEAPDGLTAAALSNWDYDGQARRGGGALSVGANLGIVAKLIGDPDLYGAAAMDGQVRVAGSRVEADLNFSSDNLNYGELGMPYGTKLKGSGAIAFDRDSQVGALTAWSAKIGEGTSLELGETKFGLSPRSAEGSVEVRSDLQLLVAMTWLQKAEGTFGGKSLFRLADEKLGADWELRFSAPLLELTANAGSAEAVEFEGRGGYDGGLSGTGTARAGKLMAAGGAITEVSGPVLFDGELLRIQQAKGNLFRGSVRADVDVGVLRENFPILLSGSFADADLAIFSDEVKPPKTQLTGTAKGSITAEYGLKGLTAFTFEAQAPGGLSVNRSLVEELLQTDKFLSGASANVAERAMDKLLGTAPQRPFDQGRITVQLAEEKITGLAVLESEKTREYNGLNLRVTLDMDKSALAEALKMLQESSETTVE